MNFDNVAAKAAKILNVSIDMTDATAATTTLISDCIGFIYNELVTQYAPLVKESDVSFTDGKALYTAFPDTILKVLSVSDGARCVPFEARYDCVHIEGSGTFKVKYAFLPSAPSAGGTSPLSSAITDDIVALGVASEYCMRNTDVESALFYKNRYEVGLANAVRKNKSFCLKYGRK